MYLVVRIIMGWIGVACFLSCSVSQKIQNLADRNLLKESALADAHMGIAVYDADAARFVYQYQAEKFFIPASNIKILSLYAGMRYLSDSIVGVRYTDTKDTLFIQPAGDPTFLHPDFSHHPIFEFLKRQSKPMAILTNNWKSEPLGRGWMWDDYNDAYMAERSAFPIYGNVIRWMQVRDSGSIAAMAREEAFIFSEPDIDWKVNFSADTTAKIFSVQRSLTENKYFITQGREVNAEKKIPFITNGLDATLDLLKDTLGKSIITTGSAIIPESVVYSQSSDSLFKRMMQRSDNFFAEQILLMVSNKKLGVMDDRRMIQYLLSDELAGFPQKPQWADGSGLSRYNLFTPQDMVWILHKMKTDFGMERLRQIFPGYGDETLKHDFPDNNRYIYAKSGSMSGVLCFSGYLYTKSDKCLIFSILINNHNQSARKIKKNIETFLHDLRLNYK